MSSVPEIILISNYANYSMNKQLCACFYSKKEDNINTQILHGHLACSTSECIMILIRVILQTLTLIYTRRMFGIEAASRACKIASLIKRSKVRKVDHTFLPEGIHIEDLTQAS